MILRLILASIAAAISIPHVTSASPILIQEVLYDGSGPDAAEAFTELAGPPGASLDGWTLVGVNGASGTPYRTLTLAGAIPVDGIYVIATSRASAELSAERDLVANVDWQNGPDAIQLWSASGALIDAIQYGDAGVNNAGEGAPAEDPLAGLSLTRDADGKDTDDNATDFRASTPTPGRIRPVSVPEPTTLWLLLASAPAVFGLRRLPPPRPAGRRGARPKPWRSGRSR